MSGWMRNTIPETSLIPAIPASPPETSITTTMFRRSGIPA